ncbi:hypothetical protein [Blastococcus brunescens]|uniref:Uncharacterized protein n=1 Tax=Blastococcus brunescens TaxID=1564165 RepID=A0ABZ1B7K2_9ACTN|nr:hypothetical protein [Blastococcus sp. BMG 8361]WRL66793.1 hypothetical protein U6N30_16295 [Blastococcus sp. BMG 8361]
MTAVLGEPATGFQHEALFYRGDDDFLAGLLPFVREDSPSGSRWSSPCPGHVWIC